MGIDPVRCSGATNSRGYFSELTLFIYIADQPTGGLTSRLD